MSKEYLEALEVIKNKFIDLFHLDIPDFDIIESALERLEAIDNANPSEALMCLDKMYDNIECPFPSDKELYDNIKQALLKAQESKHHLKWEDLELFEEQKDFFGLLNDKKYTLFWYKDSRNKYVMINSNEINIVTLCDMYKQDVDFFNNLHLERVEE